MFYCPECEPDGHPHGYGLDAERCVAWCWLLRERERVPRVNGDAWSDLLPAIARHLLGDPPAIEAGETWRYGKRGSLALHVDGPQRGTFRDFEAGVSGGVLDLVTHLVEHVNGRTAAAAWLKAEGLAPDGPHSPASRRTPARPADDGPDRLGLRDDADAKALAYAKMIWSATVQAGEVDAVRRYLARHWCWPPEIALPDCVRWLSVPAARIASRRLPAKACGALVWSFYVAGRAANAPPMSLLSGVQLEAMVPDGHRLTAWPSSSSTREAKRLTHGRLRGAYLQLPAPEAAALLVLVEGPVDALAARWLHPGAVVWCCGGALRLDPGELPAGVNAVLIEADADATPLADEIGRGLQAAGGAVQIGERQQGDVAEALALRISEHYHEKAAVLEYDGERPRHEAEAKAEAWRPFTQPGNRP